MMKQVSMMNHQTQSMFMSGSKNRMQRTKSVAVGSASVTDSKTPLTLLEENVSRITANQTNQSKLIATFTRHASAISYLMQATTIRELLACVQVALKQIFKVQKVSFLFVDK